MKNFIFALVVLIWFSSYVSACHRGKRVARPVPQQFQVSTQQFQTVPVIVGNSCVNGVCR